MLLNKFSRAPYFVINELSVLSPLNMKRFNKITIYISHTHLTHFSYTFKFLSITLKIRFFFLKLKPRTLNLQHSSMASSSARQEIVSSNQEASAYKIRGRTLSLEEWELNVQVENPVDLLSLAHHGCVLRGIYQAQNLMDYFDMLNGPTYLTLVRHFWVRAQIYDLKASQLEMDEKVLIDPSLEGKTREEMGLEPFRREEIRSSIMGIPVVISVDTIDGVISRALEGRFVYGLGNKKSPWIGIVNRTIFNSSTKGKYKELSMRTKMLLKIQKIQNENQVEDSE